MKKTLLVIIDALASEVVVPAIKNGELPGLSALIEDGIWRPRSISIFPSLTPACTTTMVTGVQPVNHNIFGYHWYDRENDEICYYGDDFWVVAKLGFADFFEGCLRKLNHERLKKETVFQRVEADGGSCASINFLMFRGDRQHTATIPAWFSWHPDVPFHSQVEGPSLLYFGDLVDTDQENGKDSPPREGGILHRFGFNDNNTARLLLNLARENRLPDFTVAYFPENDFKSHAEGPQQALDQVKEVDAVLVEFMKALGGPEAALKEFNIVVTGDHSQSDVLADSKVAGIYLDELLQDHSLAPAGSWPEDCALKACPDMRCAQIYNRRPESQDFEDLVETLLSDQRVDQVIYSDGERYCVDTRERGRLTFWPAAPHAAMGMDAYGGHWAWKGSLDSVDGRLDGRSLRFEEYPNAFERICGALNHPNSGDLWLTSHPGYEFALKDTSVHVGGGSHGSLHFRDSTSPLIVGGAPRDFELPDQPRLVDVAPLCLKLLGKPHVALGSSRSPEPCLSGAPA